MGVGAPAAIVTGIVGYACGEVVVEARPDTPGRH
jgi:hypothetical protein